MKHVKSAISSSLAFVTLASAAVFAANDVTVGQASIGFTPPSLPDILTFIIRLFFVIAGLAALLYLLLGAFAWITSGGDKGAVEKARDKIQAAIVGVLLIVIVLAVIVTLETAVFKKAICFGVSCPLVIPSLIQ